ncbi:MAG TPA: GGDEF domain-containing protein [Lachnospiraceae bacterium]|nr:GGDEF domain-containing protein [Lachnospiraceae bacterium]
MEDKKKKPIRGIRIQTINVAMIIVSCILYVLLIYTTVRVSMRYDDMIAATDNYIKSQENAAIVSDASDYLTEQVRLYVVDGNIRHVEDYFTEVNVTRRRETALEQLPADIASEKDRDYLQTALDNSNSLMEREIHAMRIAAAAWGADLEELPVEVQAEELTEEEQGLDQGALLARARDLVFDEGYQEAKKQIMDNISEFIAAVVDGTKGRQQSSVKVLRSTMLRQEICISILFIMNVLTFAMIILLIVKPLQIYINCIKEEKRLEIMGSYEFQYLALTYNDVYEVNAANEVLLRHQAEHDALTGIMNRGAFDQLKELLKMRPAPLALAIVDVDKFKDVNDGYGHEMGDRVLKKVAELLKSCFRASDYPARIGGDEFAAILMDITEDQKDALAEKIAELNRLLQNPEDDLPKVSLSVGIAFSASGFTDDLYKNADSALYEVKENGRCGCRFYEG